MKEFQKRLLLEQQKQTKILQTIASSLEKVVKVDGDLKINGKKI